MVQCSKTSVPSLPVFINGEMHMLTPDQLIAAHKANIETLFGLTN